MNIGLNNVEDNLNIVLIGMPGAGKSYIGARLARLLVQFSYLDTDEEIQNSTGMSIPEIFDRYSEPYFREFETRVIKEVSQNKNQIISIGGGAFQNNENVEALKKNGIVFYLKTSPEEIYERIKDEKHRPLLKDNFSVKKIKDLLAKRENQYLQAHFVVETDKRPAYTILDNIIKEYENYVKCCR